MQTFLILHCTYFRVEDRNDQFMQKVRRYVNVFAKNDDSDKKDGHEGLDMAHDAADTKSMQNDSTDAKRKSLICWQIVRHSLLGLDLENEEHLDAQEMKPV